MYSSNQAEKPRIPRIPRKDSGDKVRAGTTNTTNGCDGRDVACNISTTRTAFTNRVRKDTMARNLAQMIEQEPPLCKCGCVREPGSLTLPFGVGCLRFSTKSKNANTPPEWAGTLLRACFALRKQSPPQVTPVEGFAPMGKKRELHAHGCPPIEDSDGKGGIGYQVGVWHRQTPAWGRRAACTPRSWTDFTIRVIEGAGSAGVSCRCVREPGPLTLPFGVGFMFFRRSRKNINPTRMGWHASACMFCPFVSGACSGVNPVEGGQGCDGMLWFQDIPGGAVV